MALSPNSGSSDDILLFALQMAEVFRRVQWFMIRVEWEFCTTASSSAPVVLKTRFTVSSPRPSVCIHRIFSLSVPGS